MKKRTKKKAKKLFKIFLVSMLLVFAAVSGVYCAKLYTTPHSSIISNFAAGTLEEVRISKEKCNILVMGTDKDGLRTDVMMLVQIDPVKERAVVMSIPRDTRVKYKGVNRKITEVHAVGYRNGKKGSEASIIAVKELTGMPVHHYVKVNFTAFNDCIDELGGVDFNVPQRMLYSDPYQDLYINLQKGMQHLDGDKAQQLLRFRQYRNGDLGRIEVQQNFLHAVADQKLQLKYIGKIDDVYDIISENMETSMTPADMVQCGKELLSIGTENIQTITMPGTPQDIGGGSYVIVDTEELGAVVGTYFSYDSQGNDI